MVVINEWLPNPVGKDSEGEWVEILNDGDGVVNLSGWSLKANSKAEFSLSGQIKPREFRVFQKPALKLSLVNTDGELSLINPLGELVDHKSFVGLAPEGKSYSRREEAGFLFSAPTPGTENQFLEQEGFPLSSHQAGSVLNQSLSLGEVLVLTIFSGVVLASFLLFAVKKHEGLSKLFFRRDEEVWR